MFDYKWILLFWFKYVRKYSKFFDENLDLNKAFNNNESIHKREANKQTKGSQKEYWTNRVTLKRIMTCYILYWIGLEIFTDAFI